MYNPNRNRPAVCKKRPAPTAHSRLAFCPKDTLHRMKSLKLPDFVTSATSAYISPTPRSGK